jgi:hypothetical protein
MIFLNHSEYHLSSPLERVDLEDHPEYLQVSEERVFLHVAKLNPGKSAGPDDVSNGPFR